MANKKISQLNDAILLTGSELIPIVQPVDDPKDNKKITISDLMDYAINDTGLVVNTTSIITQHSITGGGDLSGNRTISLVNDVANPGNDMYYGTNGSGTRGWYERLTFNIGSGDLTVTASTGNVLFSGSNGQFIWNQNDRRLIVGANSSLSSGTDNVNFGSNTTLSGSCSFTVAEESTVRGGNSISSGWFHEVGDGVNTFSGNATTTFGTDHKNYGVGSYAGGVGAQVAYKGNTQRGGFAHSMHEGSVDGKKNPSVPYLLINDGAGSISRNTSAQTEGHGSLGRDGFILGGIDHHIPEDSPRSVILGGNAIKARAADPDNVYVPYFNITQITQDDELERVLVVNSATGKVYYRDASTLTDTGITNSAASNELMKSDGTNAVASGLFMTGTRLSFPNSYAVRKLVLYQADDNDHEFYGFGVQTSPNRMTYHSASGIHAWYAPSGPSSSDELMSLSGGHLNTSATVNAPTVTAQGAGGYRVVLTTDSDHGQVSLRNSSAAITSRINASGVTFFNGGRVGIGTSSPDYILDVTSSSASFIRNTTTGTGNIGLALVRSGGTASGWDIYLPTGSTNLAFWDGTANRFTFSTSGVASAVNWIGTSDSRLKENIVEVDSQRSKIIDISRMVRAYDRIDNGEHELGFVAQELRLVASEYVHSPKDGYHGVNYPKMVVPLYKGVAELYEEIDRLKAKLAEHGIA